MIFPILTIADKLLPWKTVKTNINEKLHCYGFTYGCTYISNKILGMLI